MTLGELNGASRAAFVAALGGIFEHSPWVAEGAFAARPFAGVADLHAAMVDAMYAAPAERQLALIRAHPELARRSAVRDPLTASSASEQSGAGLASCSADEYARLQALNERYNQRFGFPFILAVRGWNRAGVIAEFERRVESDAVGERAECLRQIARIAALRLETLVAA